jgi:hypothetical protein
MYIVYVIFIELSMKVDHFALLFVKGNNSKMGYGIYFKIAW